MMKRAPRWTLVETERRARRIVAIALLALGSEAGCGREFFREWANQDVSEAVFEKSRDPRYRLDMFSIEPPAMARFADPYDRDRPPAPPDDMAAQSLSPVPQWPDHRLLMPVEGTGYLRLLDEGPRYEPIPKKIPVPVPAISLPAAPATPALTPPPTGTPSPFAPGEPPPTPAPNVPPTPIPGPGASRANSGPKPPGMTPISLAARPSPTPASPPTRTGSPTAPAPNPRPGQGKDDGVRRVAIQDPAQPMPTQVPTTGPIAPQPGPTTAPGDPLQTPRVPGDPRPVDDNLATPSVPRRDQTPEQYRQTEEATSNLAKMFAPQNIPFDEAIAAGLPADSRPYVLTMEKAFQLAIINSRPYQFQIENIYVNALPVTLQRFAFGPQFIAGLSPRTGAAGAGNSVFGGILPTQLPANSFLYNTRATGSQLSALNLGTVAGVGKLLDNGTQILASFANSVVFNFVGKNPAQPTVRSFLPLQILVPFLRGGGRAITLEGLTQAERSLLYSVRSFAKFRQEFVVTTLTGGTIIQFGTNVTTGGFTTAGGPNDPTTGFLNVVEDVQIVENQVKNLAVFEQFVEVYKELINGESSGLSQLQLDQIRQSVQTARSQLLNSQFTYRNDLDQYKIQLGMPPDVPVVIDRSRTRGFRQIYEDIDKWSLTAKRELGDLDVIVARLPKLEDLVIDGRSCVEVFREADDQDLEDLLLIAERVALENRLDLMNARAQLYDTWRQIRVAANALKGVLNVAVTNQFLTPPTTNNPFGFVDQAKNFSLVINAELPLVRVAERNNFALQLINYQRQRRLLQNTEDFLKFQLRQEIRQMQLNYRQYEIAQRNLVLSVRLKDQAFETIAAPPAGTAGTQGAVQTTNLIQFQNSVVNNENTLVQTWYQYQLQRLQVYRDLGILPFDEWEAFDELFPSDRTGGGYAAAVGPDGRPAVARSAVASPGVGRN